MRNSRASFKGLGLISTKDSNPLITDLGATCGEGPQPLTAVKAKAEGSRLVLKHTDFRDLLQ